MIDDEEATLRIVDLAQKHFPQAKLLVRAGDRSHAYRLVKKGVPHLYHEVEGAPSNSPWEHLKPWATPTKGQKNCCGL